MGTRRIKGAKRPGPEPERVKIKGDWAKAVAKALKKKPTAKTKQGS